MAFASDFAEGYIDTVLNKQVVIVDGTKQWRPVVAPVVDEPEEVWQEITDATTTVGPGNYYVGALTGPLTINFHSLTEGQSFRIADISSVAASHPLTLDLGGTLSYTDGVTPANDTMPFVLDQAKADVTLIKKGAGWLLDIDDGGVPEILDIKPVQTADFTVEFGAVGVIADYPVDVSGSPATSVLNITVPAPEVGDRFRVTDSTLSATPSRTIQVNFNEPLMSLPAPEFAVINTAGASVEFIYQGGTVGWHLHTSLNT